jgi:hypothetical protein
MSLFKPQNNINTDVQAYQEWNKCQSFQDYLNLFFDGNEQVGFNTLFNDPLYQLLPVFMAIIPMSGKVVNDYLNYNKDNAEGVDEDKSYIIKNAGEENQSIEVVNDGFDEDYLRETLWNMLFI